MLAIDRGDSPIPQYRDRVEAPIGCDLGEADQDGKALNLEGETRQLFGARGEKCRAQQQILGGITAKRKLRRYQQLSPAAPGLSQRLDDAHGIAGEITDHLIELSDRDPHA
jgi:hypothetical protein